MTSSPTPSGPCSLQSPTTSFTESDLSGSSSRVRSSPRPSIASSSHCPDDSPTLDDDATFTCQPTGPRLRGRASFSRVSSNYRPNRATLRSPAARPATSSANKLQTSPKNWLDTSVTQLIDEGIAADVPATGFFGNFDASLHRPGGSRLKRRRRDHHQ